MRLELPQSDSIDFVGKTLPEPGVYFGCRNDLSVGGDGWTWIKTLMNRVGDNQT